MANTTIAIKKSSTPSAEPTNLANGELAINFADGKLFYKNVSGQIVSFTSGSNSFGTVNANGTLIVADTTGDILTLEAGNNITITADAINDKITISSTVSEANTIAIAAFDKANAALANSTTTYVGTLTVVDNITISNTLTTRSLTLSGIVTPTVISANTNDWAPGTTGVFEVRASANSIVNVEYNVTGLVAGANGQVVVITNTGTAPMVLKNQDAGSSAANRFAFPNHIKLYGSQTLPLYYDGISQKWRPVYSVGLPYMHKTDLTKGFFSGGYTGVVVATADHTNYSTETTAAVSGANLSQARYGAGAAGNADKGFFSGGYTTGNVATADRTNYSTETTAAVSGANLSQARYGLGAA